MWCSTCAPRGAIVHLECNPIDLAGIKANAVRLTTIPDTCPLCHRSVHPQLSVTALLAHRQLVQAIFRCTHHKCEELFIASYRYMQRLEGGYPGYQLCNIAPIAPRTAPFPAEITAVSPTFVEIYNQAIAAESHGLSQLVGIGLRKALEFLIKDFAVSQHPDKADAIRGTPLASCIKNYISDANVLACAERAAWLGNDETHYVRKWETKDVADLKRLVRLTMNWIENTLLTKKYVDEMQPGTQ
jgi:hypothetical protein